MNLILLFSVVLFVQCKEKAQIYEYKWALFWAKPVVHLGDTTYYPSQRSFKKGVNSLRVRRNSVSVSSQLIHASVIDTP
jgi:hypothetical protein